MPKEAVDIPCTGYISGEIDFPAAFGRLSQATRDLIIQAVVDPLVLAESNPGSCRFCSVSIVGHSDRYDVPGVTPEQRRAIELENSQLRAESAAAWLFTQLCDHLQNAGLTQPADWASAQTITIFIIACGSADLIHLIPANEAQRRENRRVHFMISSFEP